MKILITGATGLIGQAIVKQCLDNGWQVNYLTRSLDKVEQTDNYKGFLWNVQKNEIDQDCFIGVDVIINLAGASIAQPWTASNKRKILNSRIKSLELLYNNLPKESDVRQLVSASAIGIYPDSETHFYDETFEELSNSFLGEVVAKWELSADKFKNLGLVVTKVRIGLVLSEKGGALPKMVGPIKYYVGAAFGNGEQWQSWIHLDDLAGIFVFLSEQNKEGIFNGVAPNPVSNEYLTKEIASVLGKPLLLPNIPRFILRLILGEMHILLFESQRVSSKKVETEGFNFKYPNLKPALQDILK